jgi:hypothetical protein
MQTDVNISERTNSSGSDSDANFLGWQQTLSGEIFPLYTITVADHPSYHSTVSDTTLSGAQLAHEHDGELSTASPNTRTTK